MSSSPSHSSSPNEKDLDAFLIAVESKLRAPFSALDLTKAVASNESPRHYLQMISKVLNRMDKAVQLRVLVGLAGIEPSPETDDVIYEILQQAQEAPLFEDWVRVEAGLLQGMLFSSQDTQRRTNVGQEAMSLLEKACADIQSRMTQNASATTDMDPLFAPFYYSLLNPDTLQRILPECMTNPHFTVNTNADILKVDERMEQEQSTASTPVEPAVKPSQLPAAVMPPGRTTKKPSSGSSSMFLTSKKPIAFSAGRQAANMRKPGLHTRKAGAAQKLLGKSRRPTQTQSSSTTASATVGGRQPKFGNARSKMKMIDVSEVQGLTKERQERQAAGEDKLSARKRKIMEAAAAKGLATKKPKSNEVETKVQSQQAATAVSAPQPTSEGHGAAEASAAAALLAYQRNAGEGDASTGAPPAVPQSPDIDRKNEMNMLLENSNKLTLEDRFRIKQFFADRFNPTPDVPVYKVKLHEEKKVDPETGMNVKETYYVELDYTTFGYRKLRKTKKK